MKLSLPLTSALSLVGRQRLSMVAISCRRAYHVCSTAATARAGDMLKTAATRRGHRLLLLLRQDDHQLTTHCYAVALHAVRRYSGASDGGRHDGPITVASDHERVTVPPPPITVDALPVWNGTTTSTDRGISTVRTYLPIVSRSSHHSQISAHHLPPLSRIASSYPFHHIPALTTDNPSVLATSISRHPLP